MPHLSIHSKQQPASTSLGVILLRRSKKLLEGAHQNPGNDQMRWIESTRDVTFSSLALNHCGCRRDDFAFVFAAVRIRWQFTHDTLREIKKPRSTSAAFAVLCDGAARFIR
jgi:hypothetical protein